MSGLGRFEGRRREDGGFVFEPLVGDQAYSPVVVSGYGLPVVGPASEWYFAQEHGAGHSGLDINMRKWPRGDVELGEPVFATCNGLVVFAGMARGRSWGNLVITASVDREGLLFWRYAHLQDVNVRTGLLVPVGALVGTIGKGYGDRYWAHLHLDCWRGEMGAAEMWLSPRVEWVDPVEVWKAAGCVWEWGEG